MDKTTKFFHTIRTLRPDEAYSAQSRELIVRTSPLPQLSPAGALTRGLESLRLSSALVLASALILLLLGGLPYLKATLPLRIAGLDPAVIRAEELEIQVALDKLFYYEDSSQNVRAALSESVSTGPGQLSPTVLQKEADRAEAGEPLHDSIDKALEALIQ